MSIVDINSLRDDLLVELAKLKASNGKPQNAIELCKLLRPGINWSAESESARSAAWLLVRNQPSLAKKVADTDRPGAMMLALTAAGKAEASRLFEARQPLSVRQRLQSVSRSDWIAFGALIVSIFALLKPGS